MLPLYSSTMTAAICFIALLAIQLPSLVLGNDGFAKQYHWQETRGRFPPASAQSSTPLCQNAGYHSCCNSGSCKVQSGSSVCYCDRDCHRYGDCCQDIFEINCAFADSELIQSMPDDQFLQVTCRDLESPENGMLTYEPFTSGPKELGTVAHFSCNQHYALVGQSTLVCQDNSLWNGSEPQCQRACEELMAPENGRVTYEPDSSPKLVRTVAITSCNEGYTLTFKEDRYRVCQNSSSWSGYDGANCEVHSCMIKFAGTEGCCSSGNCIVGPSRDHCSCSVDCFANGRCCPDIGCAPRTCTEAGLNNGCCNWETGGCYVPGGECYCDRDCHYMNDCCPGINDVASCPSAANQLLTSQRVRTNPYSRVRMTSRIRGRQDQKLADEKSIRELAVELRSMSQAQEFSNKQQRAQWETILSELQELQKAKKKHN